LHVRYTGSFFLLLQTLITLEVFSMSFENLKFNKQLITSLAEAGINEPYEAQQKAIKRINGGQNLIVTGPEGSGKSTTLILSVLHRLKYPQDEPPRALILVPDKLSALQLAERFDVLGKKSRIRCTVLVPGAGIEGQKDQLAEGTDVVIGTPDRVQAVYYKSGLNINKLQLFILDDADLLIKQGFQTPVLQLADSMNRCQQVIFSGVYHQKLENMLGQFMAVSEQMEFEHIPDKQLPIIEQMLYKVPNYKTKLNLLNLLMQDYDVFDKVLVVCNSEQTAEKLYKSLNRRITGQVAVFNKKDSYYQSTDSPEHFMHNEHWRVLIASGEKLKAESLTLIPFLLHFDIPLEHEDFISRISLDENDPISRASLLFATDLELSAISKLEVVTGHKFGEEELPFGLIIEGDPHSKEEEEDDEIASKKSQQVEENAGKAYHDKKAKNAKEYNYSYKDKLKMFGKKHRKKKF